MSVRTGEDVRALPAGATISRRRLWAFRVALGCVMLAAAAAGDDLALSTVYPFRSLGTIFLAGALYAGGLRLLSTSAEGA